MVLYNSQTSGNCWKVRQLFAHLGIEYERREVDVIDRSGRKELLGELNPALRVPTLVFDGGRSLGESNAITFFFAEGTPYLPEDRFERAQVLQWQFFEQYSHEPYIAVARFWAIAGITLGGHNSNAVNPATGQPTGAAGVFDNLIEGNVVNGNGTQGQGAGILMGGGAPFSGVYGNVIRDNFARDDGLGGVTIHQHFVGDLNGNVIEGNTFINDNLNHDEDFFPIVDAATTGMLVESGPPPGLPSALFPGKIENTVIVGNRFFDNEIGIFWLGVDWGTTTLAHNVFGPGVTTPIAPPLS